MDDTTKWNLHDIIVVGSYDLRIKEFDIGGIVVEAWREETVGGERKLFDSVRLSSFDPGRAFNELWNKLCG